MVPPLQRCRADLAPDLPLLCSRPLSLTRLGAGARAGRAACSPLLAGGLVALRCSDCIQNTTSPGSCRPLHVHTSLGLCDCLLIYTKQALAGKLRWDPIPCPAPPSFLLIYIKVLPARKLRLACPFVYTKKPLARKLRLGHQTAISQSGFDPSRRTTAAS